MIRKMALIATLAVTAMLGTASVASANILYWDAYMGAGTNTTSWSTRTFNSIYGNNYSGKRYHLTLYQPSNPLSEKDVTSLPDAIHYTNTNMNASCFRNDGGGGLVKTTCWTD